VAPIRHNHWSKLRGWIKVDSVTIQDIVDGALSNKWEIKQLPLVGDVLRIDIRDNGYIYTSEWDAAESVVLIAQAYPAWMIVDITVEVNP
jgi:hypothetical protein